MAHLFPIHRLALALALLLVPVTASAHTALKRSEPARDAQLDSAPSRITLWFTAKVQREFSHVTLIGPSGEIALGAVQADTGDALHVAITQPLAAGAYLVRWRTAGADGHPVSGEFSFTLLTSDPRLAESPVPQAPLARDSIDADRDGESYATSGSRAIRWMEFAALLTILGALGFRGIVLPALASRGVSVADAADRARRLGQAAVGLYALAAAMRLYNQSAALSGSENALSVPALRILITGTTWGIGWSAGAIGALLVFAGWKLSKRYGFGLVLVIVGALGLVTAPAMTGHAVATTPAAAGVAIDAVHVAAAGLWVGGLVIVLFAGLPAMLRLPGDARDGAVSSLINSFHPLALLCAPLVVLTGLGSTWLRIPELSLLWTTTYGQTLLYKLAFFLVVLMMGAWNSARVRRRLGTPEATRHIRLTASIELFFAALVVAATTMLVVTPLPTMMGAQ